MKRIVLLLLFSYVFSFCTVVYSADNNTFTESLKTNRHLAEIGDAEGQYQLGKLYDYGKGVNRDAVEAAKWYEKAATQGHVEAQRALGLLNTPAGNYVFSTPENSVKWFQAAAEQGDPSSQYFLAKAYEKGNGVIRNYSEAANWYQKAALQGDGMAMHRLAGLYAKGLGVPKDLLKAYAWNNVSATQGWGIAKTYREELEKMMSSEQINEAQTISVKLFKKHGTEPKK